VLARESHFIEPVQVDVVSETDLLTQVDDYLKVGPREASAANVK
jgi:hypothetical protein